MALDNAQFISELSITDPPGTDAVAEGDDHIRTVKRATQQSFPNVDAAVPQTAAQMGQMAIKNEANIFTLENTFRSSILLRDASLTNPSWAFENEIGTGVFRSATGTMAFTTLGVIRMTVGQGAINSVLPFGAPDGTPAFPAYGFVSDNTSGFILAGGISVDAVVGGVTLWAMSTNGMFSGTGFAIHGDGNLFGSRNAFAFSNDFDTGMFRFAANMVGFVTGAQKTMWVEGSGVSAALNLNQTAGTGSVFNMRKDEVLRWGMGGSGVDQESWNVTRFNDAGTFLNNPLSINRASGQITLNGIPTSNPGGSNRLWKNGNVVNIT